MNYSNILFDLDGTLTDSKLGITKSVQYALNKLDIVEEDLEKLEAFIGPPLISSFMKYYSMTEQEAKTAVEYYREYFAKTGLYENQVYEGIVELLELLVSYNKKLMVATAKPTFYTEKILNYFDIDHYFSFICGSNLDGTRTEKHEIIRHVMQETGIDKKTTVMIGDRKYDITGAQENGIQSIAVTYGYGSKKELTEAGPTHIVEGVQELTTLFTDPKA